MGISYGSIGLSLPGYLFVFSATALVCFGGLFRIQRIEDDDTRRGIGALLALSGVWALTYVGYLAAPTLRGRYWFYVAGLVVGLATVGPWLYFCSAYTGRLLHRNRAVRRSAIAVFVFIATLKITNPLHDQYFTVEPAAVPFPHLLVEHEPLHWIVMGLAYALAFVGIFMLFELFSQVDYDTTPLVVVIALTGLPVVFDLVGAVTPYLLNLTYSSFGVAAFAVGITYVYLETFQHVQLTADTDQPAIVLDVDDRIRDHNRAAEDLFPELAERVGEPLCTAVPQLTATMESPDTVLELERLGVDRYYRVSSSSFSADRARLGRMITLTDITHREQYRQQLEKQNARLDQFASIVSHDLRNPLNVAKGRIDLAIEDGEKEDLIAAMDALDRMEELIEDVLSLARHGQPIDETEPVQVAAVVEQAWGTVETSDASLAVEDGFDLTVEADRPRLQQLCENLLRNAIEHGSTDGQPLTITSGALDESAGFYIEDDGRGIDPDARDEIFETGFSTAEDGTGFGLAIVTEIVDAHGWTIRATDADGGGARFEIRTVSG